MYYTLPQGNHQGKREGRDELQPAQRKLDSRAVPRRALRIGKKWVETTFFQLWGKTGALGVWHALPYHLVDVAAAAEALWERLPDASQVVPRRAFGGSPTAESIVLFFAAAHDVGKANRWFQAKAACQTERLQRAGFNLPPCNDREPERHGQATGVYLKSWLSDRWGWGGFTADSVARAVGGHHGTFFQCVRPSRLGVGEPPWAELGASLLDSLAKVFAIETAPEPKYLNSFLGWLSGFVSVADWLGSHEDMTCWETRERPLTEYLSEACGRAERLLESLRWYKPPCNDPLTVDVLVPAGREPNALQRVAAEISHDFTLAIVEAPTGEGKTEAAFALAERSRSQGAGVYFALPTMATANGLHDRVEAYLRSATGQEDLEARLLHSQAWLFRAKVVTANNPNEEGEQQETQAHDWFAGPKRGLLTPYGVGTIDQILIGALRARHGFVRLFALAGKTVVIDEVHAYDVYMGDLMEVLLGWLRALGCRVILLSATLPKTRRRALLRAWGLKADTVDGEYPCVTWANEDGKARARCLEVAARQPLKIETIAATDVPVWQQGAARILERVRTQGGLGALVLNTVRDAQCAYDWLVPNEQDGIELDLFHARFTVQDRERIERVVLNRYGKDGPRNRRAILVATQVVEQSLDLDFDHMVSALAPIDLLIQRAGRLHRHRRHADGQLLQETGSDARANPCMDVLAPPLDHGEIPEVEDSVYSPDILMRTLNYVSSGTEIANACDVSVAVEAVYGEANRACVLAAWERRLQELEQKTTVKVHKQEQAAAHAAIRPVDHEELIVEATLELDEYNETHASQLAARTRLEDRPSVTVVLLADQDITIHGGDVANPREAHLASLRISPPYSIWRALVDVVTHPAWERKGGLSRCRPLRLPIDVRRFSGFEITYDDKRGLHWRKLDGEI
jgi:CRISPR-associated endonuclease/helicase Cas3